MRNEFVAVLVNVRERSERTVANLVLRASIDQGALRPREGRLIVIPFDQVLADFRSYLLECPSQASDDRIVPAHRMPRLDKVDDAQET